MTRSVLKNLKKLIFLLLIVQTEFCFTNPSGESIINGDVSISRDGASTTIDQSSNKAIINWKEFSINEKETTNFIQPSSASSTLNRVVGDNISQIFGTLNANGKVFLLNEKGILIGPNGKINTGSFIATTLKLSNEDYNCLYGGLNEHQCKLMTAITFLKALGLK